MQPASLGQLASCASTMRLLPSSSRHAMACKLAMQPSRGIGPVRTLRIGSSSTQPEIAISDILSNSAAAQGVRAPLPDSLSRIVRSEPPAQRTWFRPSSVSGRPLSSSSSSRGLAGGPQQPPKRSGRWARRSGILVAAIGIGYIIDEYFNARTAQRNLLTAWTGVQIAMDYKLNFDRNSLESINALHERCADKLMYVCEKNQGLYVKLGQAIGCQAAILPKPYHQLTKLFDNAERLPYEEVRKVLIAELGADPKEVFAEFNEVPVAAASVAQVHKARLKPPPGSPPGTLGPEVAVKVQRPNIRKYAKWDLWSFRILLKLYERIFELPLSFSGQYISDQIEQETFFDRELANSLRAKKAIETDSEALVRKSCYVPEFYKDFCTQRVLVMEWIGNTCRMTDREKLEEWGLSAKQVSRSVCEAFASQIFQHGFVQADGHPSNVLVRKHPNGKKGQHQVVLIDHGLYVELSEDFRRKYAQLWKAIFTLDLKTLDEITVSWGMGEGSSELFASATLLRPWSKPKKKDEANKPGEHARKTDLELQREMKEKLKSFLVHTELLPKELLFVGRSMRIIQANNQVLGSPVNRLNILAKHAAAALISNTDTPSLYRVFKPIRTSNQTQRASFGKRLSTWIKDRLDFVRFRTTLLVLDMAFIGSGISHWFKFFFRAPASALLGRSDPNKGGFEDDLEQSMRQMARDEFGVELDEGAFVG
ncbi:potential mitochondrial chaperonin [Pseudozyma hubeiensis SY62]|uniref:Potential mitochondrial chaperonin n=1 Tax=Pseudozyma hubeiensis (strain SY62) TaxID=1305764 RepID=R9P6N5_PSEHS|nr:potential mitochondrial chaperonin [Pseudozyma hubeiensis SY62]GAC97021.1 potential mitochondrial chaperonin [Pseudozyma hubeiensis SY62]